MQHKHIVLRQGRVGKVYLAEDLHSMPSAKTPCQVKKKSC